MNYASELYKEMLLESQAAITTTVLSLRRSRAEIASTKQMIADTRAAMDRCRSDQVRSRIRGVGRTVFTLPF